MENLLIWLGYSGYNVPEYFTFFIIFSWYLIFLVGMFLIFRMPKSFTKVHRTIVAIILLFLTIDSVKLATTISSFTKCDQIKAILEYDLNGQHFLEAKDKYVCYHRAIGSSEWVRD